MDILLSNINVLNEEGEIISKIQKRIVEYKNNKKILSFVLDNGKRISNTTAISNIQSGKIFNAKVITRNGVQEVIAKNGFNIPTEKITIVRRNGSKSNIVLPFLN